MAEHTSLRRLRSVVLFAALGVQEPVEFLPGDSSARLSPSVRDVLARRDPSGDAWATERESSAISARLSGLAALLARATPPSADELATLAASDVVVGRLRPELATAFEDRAFRVARGAPPAEGAEHEPASGRAALAAALASWCSPFEGGPHDAHFKVLDIRAEGGRLRTHVHADAAGDAPGGRLQVNATWEASWSAEDEGEPVLVRLESLAHEEVLARGAAPLLQDCTGSLFGGAPAFRDELVHGVDHWRARLDTALGLPLLGHPAGIAIGDVDGDGREDLLLAQPGGLPNRLFLHAADGSVRDASARAGIDYLDFTRAVLLVDLDDDADRDVAMTVAGELVLLANDGSGRFTERASLPMNDATMLSAADYDGDGDLDLYVCAYSDPYGGGAHPLPYHDAQNGAPNTLLASDGAFGMTDVTSEVGLDENNTRFSFAAAWEDYDNDGDQDLYVANDFGRNNLYRNDAGRFRDVAARAGVEDIAAGMGVAWGDVDGDGWMDLYVSNMFSSAGGRITIQPQFMPGSSEETRALHERHARGNSLFLNAGDGTFRDESVARGVTLGRWAWGSVLVDLQNDGRPDVLVPNGFYTAREKDDL